MKKAITLCMLWALTLIALALPHAGSMTNPVIFADVPDLDIIRVGKTYYMVSTTMHFAPGRQADRPTSTISTFEHHLKKLAENIRNINKLCSINN